MATKYGAGAYPGKFPIGPSAEYVSPLGISENLAHEHPASVADLTMLLNEPVGTGRLFWIPDGGLVIPNTAYGKTIKSGVILGGKQAKVKWQYYGPTDSYMIPMFNIQSGGAISGLVFEGAGGYGHYGQGAGPCCIRASGQKHVIIENTDLSACRGGAVWFGDNPTTISDWLDDAQRNILRHCRVTHIQQYGFGYGVGLQGGYQSFLIEASILGWNRHSTMSSGGNTTAYEIRYCIVEESVYANSDDGPASIQSHQLDVHGGGWAGQNYRCGKHLWIHHNTLKKNNRFGSKPHICIRGLMADGGEATIEWNWSEYYSQENPPDETISSLMVMLAEEEGGIWKGPAKLSSAGVVCRNNWYGPVAPPDDDPTPPTPPPGVADIKVVSLSAPQAVLGQPYTVTAAVTNSGDAPGSAVVEIAWVTAAGSRVVVEKQTVTLAPGETKEVVQKATATQIGDWTFTCGPCTAVLRVIPQAVAVFQISEVTTQSGEGNVAINVRVSNIGTGPGTATVRLSGAASGTQTVTLKAGAMAWLEFNLAVGLAS